MSLRDLADLTNVSNPYLSQIERGLHEPSVRVLKAIADALNVSIDTLLIRAGLVADHNGEPVDGSPAPIDAATAIAADPRSPPTSAARCWRSTAATARPTPAADGRQWPMSR